MDNNEETHLPPGFRFHPTDEELVTYYLTKKVLDRNFTGRAITEVDLNKCEPWELPEKANMGEKEWYFFNLRDRKYPTGLRTNRATGCGYWKATGKDREIHSSRTCGLVGMKKTLVFYKGRAPKGEKSNWVMHEYRLDGKLSYHYLCRSSKDEWVISRVFQKIGGGGGGGGGGKKDRWIQHPSASCTTLLPPLLHYTAASSEMEHVSCFSTITAAVDTLHANFNHHHLFSLGSSLSSSSSSSAMVSSIINASVEDTSAAAADQFEMNFPSNLRLLQNNEMEGGVCSTSAGEYWLEESEHHHHPMVEKTQTSVGPTELDYVWT